MCKLTFNKCKVLIRMFILIMSEIKFCTAPKLSHKNSMGMSLNSKVQYHTALDYLQFFEDLVVNISKITTHL